MTDAEIERKLKSARRTNTAKAWRGLARELIKDGISRHSEVVQNCEDNALLCELEELEKKQGRQ